MGVYLYPSGTETELKNAYIGEVYEYGYDFRNKSVAICQADWWTFTSTSTVTINSDWLNWGTTATNIYCTPSWLTTALSGANKVTIEIMFYKGAKPSTANGTNAVLYLAWPSSYTSNWTWPSAWFDVSGNYIIMQRLLWTTLNSWTYNSVPVWTYTHTAVIDFVNKTIKNQYGSIATFNGSLTDAQISTIRTLKYVRIYTDTSAIIKTVWITVE